ncbi:putative MFS family arabinose efflux permease [Promicromonospora sp. AC04]|uniref:MFS transporter n=1 Tax=Promicromonospora sp. AC04 TaxID=2135723 RepID=UPI000D3404AE|nr:MFS transporter [Promicromonospora sp. AC04]PUB26173.1 putative MFS family arabinose efflux permease [Promicromonospora sp. AC04]
MTTTAPTAARSFWTFWAATTTSNMGSAVTKIALPLTAVLVLDAGPFETGLLAAASYLAWIVIGLPAGAIVQRWPLRATQIVTDLVRAAAIVSVPLAWWAGHLTLAQLFVVALTLNFAEVLFFSASTTFISSVVPRDQLTSRNSLMSGTHAVTELGGPSLGGLVVQLVGAAPALLFDAVSYVASAVLLRALPERRQPGDDDPTPLRRRIAEGWRFVTTHPVLAPCTWWACVVNTVCGAQHALFAIYLVRELDAPAAVVGLLLATEGVGALLAAAATPWLVRRFGSARVVLFDGLVGFAGALLIPAGIGHWGWICFAAGNLLFAASVVPGSVVTRTYRQVASPPELLSRVMGTVRFVSWGCIPLGGLIAGAVAETAGTRAVLFGSAFVMLLGPAILAASPVRRLRNLEDHESVPQPVAP